MPLSRIRLTGRGLRPLIYLLIFITGGPAYYLLEVLWRGHSHPTMAVCGGICICAVCAADSRLNGKPLYARAAAGALIITAVELVTGCLVNLTFGMEVWDYSSQPFNFAGQICLVFSLIWYLLCLPLCALCSFTRGRLYKKSQRVT